MDRVLASFDATLVPQLLRFGFVYGLLDVFVNRIGVKHDRGRSMPWILLISSIVVALLGRVWLSFVTEYVPEPYLDEVFHIPQAQRYCEGIYTWDDKITTPPGLYFASILLNHVSGFSCSVYHLRLFNVELTAYVAAASIMCRARIEQATGEHGKSGWISRYAIMTGFNIALFPVIFFFSGLYYTDVISTFSVLVAYYSQLARMNRDASPRLLGGLGTVYWGVLTLFMRQTNVFWVVVYMGGLEVVHHVKSLEAPEVETPNFSTLAEQVRFYVWRYSLGDIHDPPLNMAAPVDLILCVISVAIATVCNLKAVLFRFGGVPHVAVLAMFVLFVIVNGGVVLGDKSNHVATIHLAQLLYIWPLFVFFSAPLFIPYVLRVITSILSPTQKSPNRPTSTGEPRTEHKQSAALTIFNRLGSNTSLQASIVTIGALVVATAIVKYNTIIHPFTLADNRHYMFYVFRYSILRAWWVRYTLVPVYVLCGWLCWAALQGAPPSNPSLDPDQDDVEWIRTPFARRESDPTTPTSLDSTPKIPPAPPRTGTRTRMRTTATAPPTSTALILLLATALSLMTAPLVEPRYFILPWVFWRLHVPPPCVAHNPNPNPNPNTNTNTGTNTTTSRIAKILAATVRLLGSDWKPALALELLWFLAVNAGTMYVFLARPFYWHTASADGSGGEVLLDGGRLQRFMW